MTPSPLLAASPIIQLHTLAAFAALGLGAVQFLMAKGTPRHRLCGRVWVGLMVVVAISSLLIHTIRLWGLWSPIHILSLITLAGLWRAVCAARQGRLMVHRRIMLQLFWLALIGAGAFTLVPGRILHAVVFG